MFYFDCILQIYFISMNITIDSELEHLKDEDYLIFRAKEEQLNNPFAAKSWLITAQTIFPQNFGIQVSYYIKDVHCKVYLIIFLK